MSARDAYDAGRYQAALDSLRRDMAEAAELLDTGHTAAARQVLARTTAAWRATRNHHRREI